MSIRTIHISVYSHGILSGDWGELLRQEDQAWRWRHGSHSATTMILLQEVPLKVTGVVFKDTDII